MSTSVDNTNPSTLSLSPATVKNGKVPIFGRLPEVPVPTSQTAVVTPTVGKSLNLHLSSIAVKEPDVGEALVKILASGICRSDACFSVGPETGYPKHNHIAGHEGIGYIIRCHDVSLLGRTVAIRYLAYSCMSCVYCFRGLFTSCQSQLNAPKTITGTFQQYACVPITCLMLLPDTLLRLDEPLSCMKYTAALCSGSAALRGLRTAQVQPGDVIAIVGVLGAIGHLAGSIAKHVFGARVIGIDLSKKIKMLPDSAEQFGDAFLAVPDTDESFSVFRQDLLNACSKLRNGSQPPRLVDSVIACGSTGASFTRLDEYVCDGGSIVCVGVPRDHGFFQIPLVDLVERSLRVCGTLMGGRQEAYEVMQYIKSGLCRPIITEITLEDVPEHMQQLVDCKVIGKLAVRISH